MLLVWFILHTFFPLPPTLHSIIIYAYHAKYKSLAISLSAHLFFRPPQQLIYCLCTYAATLDLHWTVDVLCIHIHSHTEKRLDCWGIVYICNTTLGKHWTVEVLCMCTHTQPHWTMTGISMHCVYAYTATLETCWTGDSFRVHIHTQYTAMLSKTWAVDLLFLIIHSHTVTTGLLIHNVYTYTATLDKSWTVDVLCVVKYSHST